MSERIEIPAEKLHEEMLKLRQGKHMDFLRSLTGMDWGEEGLGVVYHLEDTNTRENIVTVVKRVKNPTVPKYQWSSVFWNKRLKFPFKNSRYSKVKLIPAKNMNSVIIYSM
jgi:NADH-quinone oxidoreductase subunit C/D